MSENLGGCSLKPERIQKCEEDKDGERGSEILYWGVGVWGPSPQWGPGAMPLIGGQVDEVPLKLATFSV